MNETLDRWAAATYPEHPHAYWRESGAAALHDALRGERRGTVVLPAFTCCAVPAAAAAAGKRVLLVDADRETLGMDEALLDDLLGKLDPSDTVLVIDHAFGYPSAAVAGLKRRYPDLLIAEDCVRALGSRVDGRAVGRDGDWALVSLYKVTPGNDHGAVLLSRTPREIRTGPPPAVSWRRRAASFAPLKAAHGLFKRGRPDFGETRRDRGAPEWSPTVGIPNDRCLRRFAGFVARLEGGVAAQRSAARDLRERLGQLGAIRLIRPSPGTEPNDAFLSFTVGAGPRRNDLLTALHREGLFLLRTWDQVPAFFRCYAGAFPYGSEASVFLADRVAHVPVGHFLSARSRGRLARRLANLTGYDGVQPEGAGATPPALTPTSTGNRP